MATTTPPARTLAVRVGARAACMLLALALGGCRQQESLVVLNGTHQVITAIFTPKGADLLDGAELPPQTFVSLPALSVDTGSPPLLEAFTTTGACAQQAIAAGRWDLEPADLDNSGC